LCLTVLSALVKTRLCDGSYLLLTWQHVKGNNPRQFPAASEDPQNIMLMSCNSWAITFYFGVNSISAWSYSSQWGTCIIQ